MTLPYLAALIPREHEVQIMDGLWGPIHFEAPVDIVGISFMSHHARLALQTAAEFRRRTGIMGTEPEQCS